MRSFKITSPSVLILATDVQGYLLAVSRLGWSMEKTASSAAQLLSIVEITPNHLCKGKRLSNLHFVQNFGCQNDLSLSKLIANKHVARVRIFTDLLVVFTQTT